MTTNILYDRPVAQVFNAPDRKYFETTSAKEKRGHLVFDSVEVKLHCASAVVCQPIKWLWRQWIAQGKLHILAGAPGTGKTTIAIAIAAVISRGGTFPDGTRAPRGNVLIWSGEDDWADTLTPRLKAAGADLSRVHFVGDTTGDDEPRPFDPARHLVALETAAAQLGDIKLLIADPVVSAVTGDSHKNTEVRRALQPIVYLAQRLDCAVLGISHFSKGTAGREPLERVTGSVAFGALARIVLVAAKGAEGEPRLLARAKSNIGPDGGGFSYELKPVEFDGLSTCVIEWGAALEGTARELLGIAEIVADSPRDDAILWLSEILANGPVPVKAIRDEASSAGASWRTIETAKSELGVIAERVSSGNTGGGHWEWRLPASCNTASPTTKSCGLAENKAAQGFEDSQGAQHRKSHGEEHACGLADEAFDV
jgi:energy-coupling factor transporter ATP-binding protein EcfA2